MSAIESGIVSVDLPGRGLQGHSRAAGMACANGHLPDEGCATLAGMQIFLSVCAGFDRNPQM